MLSCRITRLFTQLGPDRSSYWLLVLLPQAHDTNHSTQPQGRNEARVYAQYHRHACSHRGEHCSRASLSVHCP